MRDDWPLVLERIRAALRGWRAVSITCPRCGSVSYRPEDIAAGYCGQCPESELIGLEP